MTSPAHGTLVLMAVLPRAPEEAEVFREEIGGLPLYERAIRLLAAIPDSKAVLATNLPEAETLGRDLGVEVATLPGWEQDSPPYLASHAALLEKMDLADARTAVILDPRYCFLSPELLRRAVDKFVDTAPAALVSAGPTKDNPAQVMHGMRILHSGQIIFLEEHDAPGFDWLHRFTAAQEAIGNVAPYLASRPFPFPWVMHSSASGEARMAALCHLAYSPSQNFILVNASRLHFPYYRESRILGYYYRESDCLARRLVSTYWLQRRMPRNIIGVSPFEPMHSPRSFCIRDSNVPIFCLSIGKPVPGATLRIWPHRNGVILQDEVCSLDIPVKEPLPYPLTATPSFPVCALHQATPSRWDGFSFALLAGEGDDPDHMELLPLQGAPYTYDHERVAVVNASGEPITGRQKFPPVYTLSSAFTIFRPGDAKRALEALSRGETAAFPVTEKESLAVEDLFDVEVARSIL